MKFFFINNKNENKWGKKIEKIKKMKGEETGNIIQKKNIMKNFKSKQLLQKMFENKK